MNPSDIRVHQATKDVSVNCYALIDLFETVERFLSCLDIYSESHLTAAMKEMVVKIMAELLSTIALLTRQIKQRRPRECLSAVGDSAERDAVKLVKNLPSEDEIEAVLQRLGKLTQGEARTTTTAQQTIKVVYGLLRNMRAFMDGVATPFLSFIRQLNILPCR
jgi:hypothetical protein